MIASVCWTPFQIINAINYKLNYEPNKDMDIYICLKFTGAQEVAECLKKFPYIHNVYVVNNIDYDSCYGLQKKIKIFQDLCFPIQAIENSVTPSIKLDDLNYEIIASSGFLNFNIYFSTYFQKKGAKIVFFDDGIESYLEKNSKDNYSKLYKICSNLTGNGGTNLKIKSLYVYCPDLVSLKNPYCNIYQLPALTKLPDFIKSDFNKMFYYRKWNIDYHILLFDQLGTGDFQDDNEMRLLQSEILKSVEKFISAKNILIKLHPRTSQNPYNDNYQILQTSIPWEVIMLNEEVENKVLMSLSSTACFTPKLIFDEEPTVIFLYKIFLKKDFKAFDAFVQKVRKLYRNQERFFIPQSVKELTTILEKIG